MPSNVVDEVSVLIKGDDSDLNKKLADSAKQLLKWSSIAIAAGAAATTALVNSGLKSADAQAKLATQLGTTSKEIAILERSSELAGVSQSTLEGASKALTVRLSQAATGTGTAVAALDSLGLSAEELIQLPLSERIALINKSMLENADASERASLAAQFFGEDAGLAVSKISPDTINQAATEVTKFGAALSELDAAKIEAANDAMSQAGLVYTGVTQQLAVEFAPMLTEISNRLGDAAAESGVLSNIAEETFNVLIAGAGFAADAVHGIALILKVGEVAFDGFKLAGLTAVHFVVRAFDDLDKSTTAVLNTMIANLNSLPGIDIDKIVVGESQALIGLTASLQEAQDEFNKTNTELVALASEPLPSDKLDTWADDIRKAADKAAEGVVATKEAINAVPLPELVGGLSEEDLTKQQEALAASLETTIAALQTEQEAIDEAYLLRSETLNAALQQSLLTQEEFNTQQERSEQDHQDKLTDIANASTAIRLQVASQMFGNLATLMQTENKKLFEIGKVAAIAQATVNGIEATISSYKAGAQIGGPVLGAAFAATAAVATGVQIAKLSSTSYGSGGGGAAPGTPGSVAPSITQDATSGAGGTSNGTLTVQGLTTSSLFSGEAVAGLAEELLDYQRRGGNVVLQS